MTQLYMYVNMHVCMCVCMQAHVREDICDDHWCRALRHPAHCDSRLYITLHAYVCIHVSTCIYVGLGCKYLCDTCMHHVSACWCRSKSSSPSWKECHFRRRTRLHKGQNLKKRIGRYHSLSLKLGAYSLGPTPAALAASQLTTQELSTPAAKPALSRKIK